MKHAIHKGEYGYIGGQRKRTLFRTLLFFAISFAVYLTGYISTGTNQNLLTIAAVLGCLPACKSAVNTIMFYRYRGCNEEDYTKIHVHVTGGLSLWDLVFTSYDKNFEIHHLYFNNDALIGYAPSSSCDRVACEKHLKGILMQNGLSGIAVKIFDQLPPYMNRLDQLAREGEEAEEKILRMQSLLCAISL